LIYTRWEAPPRASRPSVPIDYLVVIPLTPRPDGPLREPQYKSRRVEPAPVGLHLHCWGGSLNGGYGWWYNGHRGAVLIASNQIPYDWWTGHHESRGTRKTFGDGVVQPFSMDRTLSFLDWAARQHREAPESVREFWPELDLTRVFTAGNSMGGSGAPMFAVRHGDRIAWALGWVGVHVPELSPQFAGSYRHCYGPRDRAITMPDGKTSPWDFFSDVWWLKNHVAEDTGLIIASNGKNDGGIGWEQAYRFARALQETRRPHFFNWDIQGHGTHTRIGANFELDVRSNQTLPAFTNCSLDDDIGTAKRKSDEQIAAERRRQEAEIAAGKRTHVHIDPYDGGSQGQYNAYLWWQTDDVVDTPDRWEMTVLLKDDAPRDSCTVDLTPRRCQRFRPESGTRLTWTNTAADDRRMLGSGEITTDQWELVTLKQLTILKGENRIVIKRK
jgi:pimeloyl-ACP methyl ester carboxylesterase